jgi:hypothetical protein
MQVDASQYLYTLEQQTSRNTNSTYSARADGFFSVESAVVVVAAEGRGDLSGRVDGTFPE